MPRPPLLPTLAAALAACLTVPLWAGPQEDPPAEPASSDAATTVIEWSDIDLNDYLNGKMPWVESVEVTALVWAPAAERRAGAEWHREDESGLLDRGTAKLKITRTDGRGPFDGEINVREARGTLARYALPLEAGQVLRPVADAGGPTEAPGLWRDSDLERFLAGGMPGVESLTVLKINAGEDVGRGGEQASVTFRVDRSDGLPSQTGKMTLYEAQSELAEVGLSLKVGGALRPLPGGLGGGGFGGGGLGRASGGFGIGGGSRVPRAAVDTETAALVEDLRNADDAAKPELRQRLDALLAEHFDAAQTEREEALAALETKVKRLRSLHDKRAAAKAEIVARRADTLLREADGLGWGAPGGDDGPGGAPFGRAGGGFGGPATLPPDFGAGGAGGAGFGGNDRRVGGIGGGHPDVFVRDLRPEPGQTVPVSGVEVRRDRVVVSFSSGTEDGLEVWDRLELLDGDGAVIGRVRLTSTGPDSAQAIAKGDTDAIIEAGRAGTLTARLPLDDTAEKAERGGGVRLLFFTNDQAEPAEKLRPFVDSLIEEGEPVTVVNTAERPDVMKRHGVTAVPTFVLLVDGEEVFRNVGLTGGGARTVADRIRRQLARAKSRE